MKIAILLPYKENFSKYNAGAVSIFVNSLNKHSQFKNNITVFGNTDLNKTFDNYININLKKKFFLSTSSQYLKNFLNKYNNHTFDLLEIHNRPAYLKQIREKFKCPIFLFIHNDPLNMNSSRTVDERIKLLEQANKIICNSKWTKSRFLKGIQNKILYEKVIVIYQSTSRVKVDLSKKKKIISFIGKLNSSKGYDIFCEAIIKILDKHKDWKALVIGDEPRQKYSYKHKRLIHYGYKDNNFILNKLKYVSISVVPSKWDEPFGRSSLEASSRGAAVIISNTGGLAETSNHAIVIKNVSIENIYNKVEKLIVNKKYLKLLQNRNYKNFKLTNAQISTQVDNLRKTFLKKNIYININKLKTLKILHITNFNERFDGRLHYNTGKRLNNGFIRLGHNVLSISDRDIISNYKSFNDPTGRKTLNQKIIFSNKNFNPDLIILGHADNVDINTLQLLKEKNKNLKIAQWFLDPVSKSGPDYLNNKKRVLRINDYMDANFITTHPEVINFNLNNPFYMPNPSDESFEILANDKNDCYYDMFFAMSHGVHRGKLKEGKFDKREDFINKIIRNPKINLNYFGLNKIQPIWGNNFLKELSKSKMGLNLSRGKPVKYYSSDRIAQLMGNGLLTFIDEKTSYSDFFSNEEMVFYKNYSDLVEKVLKYKRDDKQRRRIARNGRLKYNKSFNSKVVARFIIEKTLQIKNKTKYIWTK